MSPDNKLETPKGIVLHEEAMLITNGMTSEQGRNAHAYLEQMKPSDLEGRDGFKQLQETIYLFPENIGYAIFQRIEGFGEYSYIEHKRVVTKHYILSLFEHINSKNTDLTLLLNRLDQAKSVEEIENISNSIRGLISAQKSR